MVKDDQSSFPAGENNRPAELPSTPSTFRVTEESQLFPAGGNFILTKSPFIDIQGLQISLSSLSNNTRSIDPALLSQLRLRVNEEMRGSDPECMNKLRTL